MKSERNGPCAVITGDLIKSSNLSPNDWRKLHSVMKESSRLLRAAFKGMVPLDVDIFRGDSWQILVLEPAKALRLSLFYRATLRAKMERLNMDTRMAIAVGKIDALPRTRVSEGHGEAYRLSGEALDRLHGSKAGNMCFVHEDNEHAATLDIIVRLIDALAARWTDKQALAISGALKGMRQEEMAKRLWKEKITQQAVAQHLRRAGWYALETGIDFFEKALRQVS